MLENKTINQRCEQRSRRQGLDQHETTIGCNEIARSRKTWFLCAHTCHNSHQTQTTSKHTILADSVENKHAMMTIDVHVRKWLQTYFSSYKGPENIMISIRRPQPQHQQQQILRQLHLWVSSVSVLAKRPATPASLPPLGETITSPTEVAHPGTGSRASPGARRCSAPQCTRRNARSRTRDRARRKIRTPSP